MKLEGRPTCGPTEDRTAKQTLERPAPETGTTRPRGASVALGLLGGTFNPVHLAHLRLAEVAREALELASVCFIPAAQPPLKHTGVAPALDRLEMVALATAANPHFQVLDIELERSGPSYTVDTLGALRALAPERPLWFLLGSDALADLESWHRPERLFELANLGVAARDGDERPLDELLPRRLAAAFEHGPHGLVHRGSGQEIRKFAFPSLAISASEIRARVASGRSIRYLVPENVIEYITKHGLYTEVA